MGIRLHVEPREVIWEKGLDGRFIQAPGLRRAILEGRQPAAMNLQAIVIGDLPLAWHAQRAHFRG